MSNITGRDTRQEGQYDLPEILEVEATRVRYPQPRIYFVGREQREAREAVEILVRTSRSLPVMAMPPVIFVGETPILEYGQAGPKRYRFYVFQPERLQAGSPISIGWPDDPASKVPTRFRYEPSDPAAA